MNELEKIDIEKKRDEKDEQARKHFMQYTTGQCPPDPQISLYDLSPQMQRLIGKHVEKVLATYPFFAPKLTESMAYLFALSEFGVKCPHMWRPMWRDRNGKQEIVEGVRVCVDCECWEVSQCEPEANNLIGQFVDQSGKFLKEGWIPSPPPPSYIQIVPPKMKLRISEEPIMDMNEPVQIIFRRECRLDHNTFLYVQQP